MLFTRGLVPKRTQITDRQVCKLLVMTLQITISHLRSSVIYILGKEEDREKVRMTEKGLIRCCNLLN